MQCRAAQSARNTPVLSDQDRGKYLAMSHIWLQTQTVLDAHRHCHGLVSQLHSLHYLRCALFWLQRRALTTYVRRIYHPFLQQQPTLDMTDRGLVMLWTYTQPATSDVADAPAMLGAAVVIPALADLPEAAAAVQSIVTELGKQSTLCLPHRHGKRLFTEKYLLAQGEHAQFAAV